MRSDEATRQARVFHARMLPAGGSARVGWQRVRQPSTRSARDVDSLRPRHSKAHTRETSDPTSEANGELPRIRSERSILLSPLTKPAAFGALSCSIEPVEFNAVHVSNRRNRRERHWRENMHRIVALVRATGLFERPRSVHAGERMRSRIATLGRAFRARAGQPGCHAAAPCVSARAQVVGARTRGPPGPGPAPPATASAADARSHPPPAAR